MKKLLILLLFLSGSVSADTLGGLRLNLRERTGESDTASSSYSDATANRWLNLSAERIYWLTLSNHAETTFAYSPTVNVFNIPPTREVRAVFAKVGTRWYDITGDPQALDLSVTRADSAITAGGTTQWSRVTLQIGGFVPRTTDLSFSIDSVDWNLPSDFRRMEGMMARSNGEWLYAVENPLFMVDTNITSYFVGQQHIDSAILYVKTPDLVDGDTLRVFYLAGPISGDSVRISYYSQATVMSADSTECLLDDDMEGFVIEEAVRYYFNSIRDYQGAQIMQQSVRGDIRQ